MLHSLPSRAQWLLQLLLNGFVSQILLHKRVNLLGNSRFELGFHVVAAHHLIDSRVDFLRLLARHLTGFDRLAVILRRQLRPLWASTPSSTCALTA